MARPAARGLRRLPHLAEVPRPDPRRGAFLGELLGAIPANWDCLAFGAVPPQTFLGSLDAYVYFHSSAWIEAFGRNVLEALATGLPVILPASFKLLFREAAIYGEPAHVQDILEELQDNPANLRSNASGHAPP